MSYIVRSRCECQATLIATLSDARHVIHGSARQRGLTETAAAHAISPEREFFDVAWSCPFCGRNTLRSFDANGLEASGA